MLFGSIVLKSCFIAHQGRSLCLIFKSALFSVCDISHFPEIIDDYREKRVLGRYVLGRAIGIYREKKKNSTQEPGAVGIQVFIGPQ